MAEKDSRAGYVTIETLGKLSAFLHLLAELKSYGILCEEYIYGKGEKEFSDLSFQVLKICLATQSDGFFSELIRIPSDFIKRECIEEDGNYITIVLGMSYILKQCK